MSCTFALILCILAQFFIKVTPYNISETKNRKEVLIGRCYDYQNTQISTLKERIDCDQMYKLFNDQAVKPSCTTTDPDYNPLLNFMQRVQKIPKNKSLFWSGTKEIANILTLDGSNYFMLETTFAGNVFNNVGWCGESAQLCSGFCSNMTLKTNSYAFWAQASSMYAASAEGDVTLLLNGGMRNGRTAYYDKSTFALYELPNLNAPRITSVQVILVFDLKNYGLKNQKETCTQGSILALKEQVIAKNITFLCEERSLEVVMLQCYYKVKDPTERRICQDLINKKASKNQFKMAFLTIIIFELIVAKIFVF